MAENEAASSVLFSELKNGKLNLNKVATQLAQFMEVDTAKDVSIACDEVYWFF